MRKYSIRRGGKEGGVVVGETELTKIVEVTRSHFSSDESRHDLQGAEAVGTALDSAIKGGASAENVNIAFLIGETLGRESRRNNNRPEAERSKITSRSVRGR